MRTAAIERVLYILESVGSVKEGLALSEVDEVLLSLCLSLYFIVKQCRNYA